MSEAECPRGDEDDFEIDEDARDDIGNRLRALDDAQRVWEKVTYLTSAKMPCPECGGSGRFDAGSLGGTCCPECFGARVIDHPAAGGPHPDMPRFPEMRVQLTMSMKMIEAGGAVPASVMKELPSVSELTTMKKDGLRAAYKAPGAPVLKDADGEKVKLLGGRRSVDAEDGTDWGDGW